MTDHPRRAALATWIDTSRPGARYIYHIGHLIHDRLASPDLDLTAAFAWEQMAKDRVLLTQIRAVVSNVRDRETANAALSSEPVYLYIATRTKRHWTGGQGGS